MTPSSQVGVKLDEKALEAACAEYFNTSGDSVTQMASAIRAYMSALTVTSFPPAEQHVVTSHAVPHDGERAVAWVWKYEDDDKWRDATVVEPDFDQEARRRTKRVFAPTFTHPAPVAAQAEGWEDDPSSDERWNAGLDFAMNQLCIFLGVDPKSVVWDAATETVDGDVRSVMGNIMRAKYGEDWGPRTEQRTQALEDAAGSTLDNEPPDMTAWDKSYAAAFQDGWAARGRIARSTIRALASSPTLPTAPAVPAGVREALTHAFNEMSDGLANDIQRVRNLRDGHYKLDDIDRAVLPDMEAWLETCNNLARKALAALSALPAQPNSSEWEPT